VNQESRKPAAAIISPPIDAICGGGLSLCVVVVVIAYTWLTGAAASQAILAIQAYLLTDLLINGPHFMASYRLLYSRPSNFRDHPIVTILMPIVAVAFLGYVAYWCFADPESTSKYQLEIIVLLNWVAPVFLGWHYMGQSWGMTACFAYIGGLRMTPTERRLIRSGFHALFIYHVAWAYDSMGIVQGILAEGDTGQYLMQFVMSACRMGVFVGFVLGLWGFRRLSQREGKKIPIRVWLPWLATFSWYVMVDVNAGSFFLLQAFHALQYLTFPVRVELNEYTNPLHKWRHLLLYYIALVVFGYLAFDWSDLLGGLPDSQLQMATATMMVINLHHYFTDAVIWKIRNPEVRKSLFGHLDAAA
jgi:hypothetical protein